MSDGCIMRMTEVELDVEGACLGKLAQAMPVGPRPPAPPVTSNILLNKIEKKKKREKKLQVVS